LKPFPIDPFDASGCFETCRVRGGVILYAAEHRKRLVASLKTVGISASFLDRAWAEAVVTAKTVRDGVLRIAIRRAGNPAWLIHAHEGVHYSPEQLRNGVAIRTVPSRWPMGETAVAGAKISERLSSIFAKMEEPEAVEQIRIGRHGYLTEGTVSNLFLVSGNRLVTPATWLGVLSGVTRARVIRAAKQLSIPVDEIPVTRHDLYNAREAFLTNALMGALPVREVDGRLIGEAVPGLLTKRISIYMKKESQNEKAK
jgi:branched-chain amino acid aminotransferase